MITLANYEQFIEAKSRVLLNQFNNPFNRGTYKVYDGFYQEISQTDLRLIFSILHDQLNRLFSFMNSKKNKHYNANESRELLSLINLINTMEANLKGSKWAFVTDEYYRSVLKTCKTFLSESLGSTIPDDFIYIDLIENRPIFNLIESIVVTGTVQTSAYTTTQIGHGSYATVHKYHDSFYNRFFAIKRANKTLTYEELQRFKIEYEQTKKLNSPYIIEVFSYNDEKNEYILEYADTNLYEYIENQKENLNMASRINLVLQIFRAFSHIHDNNLLHRDISFFNILLKLYNDDSKIIKVSDFGMVKMIDSNLTRKDTKVKGSLNDPSLLITGFENYEIRHEIFALTRLINFVLSGRERITYKSEEINKFFNKGIAPKLEDRFPNLKEMIKAFNQLRTEFLKEENE